MFKGKWFWAAITAASFVVTFQNCSRFTGFKSRAAGDSNDFSTFSSVASMPKQNPKYMENQIARLANGSANPAFGAQIRNVLLVQIGGWSGLPTSAAHDPDYPLAGGRTAYLTKNPNVYAQQMELIRGLGNSVAVTYLLMNDADSNASGYGACWQGTWTNNQNCSGGAWRRPMALYREAKAAANARGIPVAPEFSIMNYQYGLGNGAPHFLPRLRDFLAWARPTFDNGNLRNGNGQYVVIVDGLYEWTPLNDTQRTEIMAYMQSQTDILWVDNMVGPLSTGQRSTNAPNVFSTSWGNDAAKSTLAQIWGESYVYTYTSLLGAAPTLSLAQAPGNQVPQSIREKWLNISPYRPTQYPVFIHQWNEYAEYLIFEPSQRAGYANYEYLKSMIARQQPIATPDPIDPPDLDPPALATELLSINISALTAHHADCSTGTIARTPCLAAANRYCTARQMAGGFSFISASGTTSVVCLKAPDSRSVATTFTQLSTHHESCASSANSDSPGCLAATNRLCIALGYRGGIGIMEYNGNAAAVLCSMKLRPTLFALAQVAPACTTANARSRECAAASDQACRSQGYLAGYGLIEYSSTDAVLNCVEP